jgi:hypothetical protein
MFQLTGLLLGHLESWKIKLTGFEGRIRPVAGSPTSET